MTTTFSSIKKLRQTGSVLFHTAKTSAHIGIPGVLLHFGTALGDDLLCTAVFRELTKRGQKNIWIMSEHPELFSGNPDVAKVIPIDEYYGRGLELLGSRYKALHYGSVELVTDRTLPPTRHVIAEMCASAGIDGDVSLRPYFHPGTTAKAQTINGKTLVAIQSSGLGARWPTVNKEWYPERFQGVVDELSNECEFVQIGSPTDPLLAGTRDLRGKTTVHETAALLTTCRLYVGGEGFLMHLARAVECPSVIIFGGRVTPWQCGYSCNTNLYSAVPCAPCWLRQPCDHERRCMQEISVAAVVTAVRDRLAAPREPLKVDTERL